MSRIYFSRVQSLGQFLKPPNSCSTAHFRKFHISSPLATTPSWRKAGNANLPFKQATNDTIEGEKYMWLDTGMLKDRFPTIETANELFAGVPFKNLPIVHMKVTKNNTKMLVSSAGEEKKRQTVCVTTAGVEGFKNCRKGTTVAAQAVGVGIGLKMKRRGVHTARLCISGFGPGRMAAVEGLIMTGVNIVSITDTTDINEFGPRPRKARRL